MNNTDKKEIFIFLFIIVFIGFILRLTALYSSSLGIFQDEASNGLDALRIIQGERPIFILSSNGKEPLFHYLLALLLTFTPFDIFWLRFVSVILSTITIVTIYLFTKQLFQSHWLGLISAYFFSISLVPLIHSQLAFRAVLVPLLLSISWYLLLRAIDSQSPFNALMGGLFYGLGLYSYFSFWASILLFIPLVPLITSKNKKTFFLFFLSSFIVALPILIYIIQHFAEFIYRPSQIALNSTKQLILNYWQQWLSLILVGDSNWRHNISNLPYYSLAQLLLALWGIFFSIKLAITQKKWRFIFPLFWMAIMLLPAAASTPLGGHFLRSNGITPVVFILPALGIFVFYHSLREKLTKKIFISCLVILAIIQIYLNFITLNIWMNSRGTYFAFKTDLAEIYQQLTANNSNYPFKIKIITSQREQNIFIWLNLTNDKKPYLLATNHIEYPVTLSKQIIILPSRYAASKEHIPTSITQNKITTLLSKDGLPLAEIFLLSPLNK